MLSSDAVNAKEKFLLMEIFDGNIQFSVYFFGVFPIIATSMKL